MFISYPLLKYTLNFACAKYRDFTEQELDTSFSMSLAYIHVKDQVREKESSYLNLLSNSKD